MRVYDLVDKEGLVYAFEINSILGRWKPIRVISAIPGVQNVWTPSLSWVSPDVFCKFELDGVAFEIEEPFGDNSRFWIGPVPTRHAPQLEIIRQAFIRAKPLPW